MQDRDDQLPEDDIAPTGPTGWRSMSSSARLMIGVGVFVVVAALAGGIMLWTSGSSEPVSPAMAVDPAPPAVGTLPTEAATQTAPATTQPAAGEPAIKVLKREVYGDWVYTCAENQASKLVLCSISQEISESQTKQMVFLWRIAQDGKDGLTAVWQTPDGVLLPAGIKIDAGTPQPVSIPFQTCVARRCQAIANLAADFQETLTKAQKAVATIVFRNGKAVAIPLSVKGLAEGIAALKQPAPAPG